MLHEAAQRDWTALAPSGGVWEKVAILQLQVPASLCEEDRSSGRSRAPSWDGLLVGSVEGPLELLWARGCQEMDPDRVSV